jgi:hypothetical protein
MSLLCLINYDVRKGLDYKVSDWVLLYRASIANQY